MKGKINIHYDNEGDLLEFRIGSPKPCFMNNLGDGIFERVDQDSGEVSGFTIINFKKRSEKSKNLDLVIPSEIEISN